MTVIAEGCKTCNRTMFAQRENDPDAIVVDKLYITPEGEPFMAVMCKVFLNGDQLLDVMAVREGEWALRVVSPVVRCTCCPFVPYMHDIDESGNLVETSLGPSYAAYVDTGPYVVEPSGLRPFPENETVSA